jgi:hypothetical protein
VQDCKGTAKVAHICNRLIGDQAVCIGISTSQGKFCHADSETCSCNSSKTSAPVLAARSDLAASS